MKQIGDVVVEEYRNPDGLSDLEYPYAFAHDDMQYFIWHRETGEIVWIRQLDDKSYLIAYDMCRKFNGFDGV